MKPPGTRDYRRWITLTISALAVAATLWLAVRLLSAGLARHHFSAINQRLIALSDFSSPSDHDAPGQPSDSAADDPVVLRITGRNVFSPPAPKGFQGQLVGVLGDRAVFQGGQSAGVGEQVAGATIKAIGADWVEIEFEGKTRRLSVFASDRIGGEERRPPGAMEPTPRMIEQSQRLTPEQREPREQAKRTPPPGISSQIEQAMKGQP